MARKILYPILGTAGREVETITSTTVVALASRPTGANYAEIFIEKDATDTADYQLRVNFCGENPDASDARFKDGDVIICETPEMIDNIKFLAIDGSKTTKLVAYYYHKTQ